LIETKYLANNIYYTVLYIMIGVVCRFYGVFYLFLHGFLPLLILDDLLSYFYDFNTTWRVSTSWLTVVLCLSWLMRSPHQQRLCVWI